MSEARKKWTKVGEILKGKDKDDGSPGELYIKIKADVSLATGDTVQIKDPRKSLSSAVERGTLSREKADEMLGKIQSFHRYDLLVVNKD